MATIKTLNSAIGYKMMGLVRGIDYRARLDLEMGTFVTGFDRKAEDILARLWDVHTDLEEAKIDGNNWLVELTCSSLDYDALLHAALNDMDADKAFEKVMCHTFFEHECYNSVLDGLDTAADVCIEGGEYYRDCFHKLHVKGGALYRYVHEYIEECDVRFETTEGELIDDIVSQDW